MSKEVISQTRHSVFLGGFVYLEQQTGILFLDDLIDLLEPKFCLLDVFPQGLVFEFYDLF